MLQMEHSAMLSTFIKLHVPVVIKAFILSIFEWPFYTGLTVFLAISVPGWTHSAQQYCQ